jgi:hypothetical protein
MTTINVVGRIAQSREHIRTIRGLLSAAIYPSLELIIAKLISESRNFQPKVI